MIRRLPGSTRTVTLLPYPTRFRSVHQLRSTLHLAARYFPLPVHFECAPLPYEDFLAGAAHIELWEGCRIGIFHDGTTEAVNTPRINFHGVTVASRLPTLSEIESPHNWRVRVDVGDAPAHQDRKSIVSGKGVYVRVDVGGSSIINKKK